MTEVDKSENLDTPRGLGLAVVAYVLWGFLPLYMKLLAHIPAAEVVVHRVIWSVPIAGAVLLISGRTHALSDAIASPRKLMLACLTAALVSVNWGIYVWAIANDQALEAALGYYINPLFSILLATVLLGERMTRAQLAAVALAFVAVVVLTMETGRLPVVALGLTLTWGLYAFFKKSLPIGPNQGFLLEVLILTPPAVGYLIWLASQGQNHFFDSAGNALLLLGCGVVTSAPLMIYANCAKLLRLSTIGILQYIVPTMLFLVAVLVFDEPFTGAKRIAFPMIWAALVLYSTSMLRQMRKRR